MGEGSGTPGQRETWRRKERILTAGMTSWRIRLGLLTTSFLLGFMSCSCQPGLFMLIFHLPPSFYFLSSAGICPQELGFSPLCGWLCPFILASGGSSEAQSLTLAQAKQTSKQGADAQAVVLMPIRVAPPRLSQGHTSTGG